MISQEKERAWARARWMNQGSWDQIRNRCWHVLLPSVRQYRTIIQTVQKIQTIQMNQGAVRLEIRLEAGAAICSCHYHLSIHWTYMAIYRAIQTAIMISQLGKMVRFMVKTYRLYPAWDCQQLIEFTALKAHWWQAPGEISQIGTWDPPDADLRVWWLVDPDWLKFDSWASLNDGRRNWMMGETRRWIIAGETYPVS